MKNKKEERNITIISIIITVVLFLGIIDGILYTKKYPEKWQQEISQFHQ